MGDDNNKQLLACLLRSLESSDKIPVKVTIEDLLRELDPYKSALPSDYLQNSSNYILHTFLDIRIETLRQQIPGAIIDQDASQDSDESDTSESSEIAEDEQFGRSIESSELDESLDSNDEQSIEPTLDEETTKSRPDFISVYLPNRLWDGAAVEYCHEDESFISLQWASQRNLNIQENSIRLTWKYADTKKSNCTVFILNRDLGSDFMIGKMCYSEDFNREDDEPLIHENFGSHGPFDMSMSSPPGRHSTQDWLKKTMPDTALVAELITQIELKYRQMGTQMAPPAIRQSYPPGAAYTESSIRSSSSARRRRPSRAVSSSKSQKSRTDPPKSSRPKHSSSESKSYKSTAEPSKSSQSQQSPNESKTQQAMTQALKSNKSPQSSNESASQYKSVKSKKRSSKSGSHVHDNG